MARRGRKRNLERERAYWSLPAPGASSGRRSGLSPEGWGQFRPPRLGQVGLTYSGA